MADYHLRVLLPFARDPAYYASIITEESDTPSKEGPVIHGAIKLYEYPIWPRTVLEQPAPLTPAQAGDLATRLQTIPPLLQAARSNLAGANAASPLPSRPYATRRGRMGRRLTRLERAPRRRGSAVSNSGAATTAQSRRRWR